MSSNRFPGKVLAPFRGQPLLRHVLRQVESAIGSETIVLATSTDDSDDPLAAYARTLGIAVFRGPLSNVVRRFQLCLLEHPCSWFFRVCGDSPLLDATLFSTLLDLAKPGVHLVTNTFPRTFPKGSSLELIHAETFRAFDAAALTKDEQEHVTKAYYDHPSRFRIVNVAARVGDASSVSLAVDTIEDLLRLEQAGDSLKP